MKMIRLKEQAYMSLVHRKHWMLSSCVTLSTSLNLEGVW
jgi:hypothetical protein